MKWFQPKAWLEAEGVGLLSCIILDELMVPARAPPRSETQLMGGHVFTQLLGGLRGVHTKDTQNLLGSSCSVTPQNKHSEAK